MEAPASTGPPATGFQTFAPFDAFALKQEPEDDGPIPPLRPSPHISTAPRRSGSAKPAGASPASKGVSTSTKVSG